MFVFPLHNSNYKQLLLFVSLLGYIGKYLEVRRVNIMFQVLIYSLVGIAGIVIQELLPFLFPAAIISMLLLLLILLLKVVKSETIAPLSNALLKNIGLFFIIPTISIISYIDILEQHLISFIIICIVATIITFIASSSAVRFTIFVMKKLEKSS